MQTAISQKSHNIRWHGNCNGVANCNKSRQNCPPWDITTVDKPVIYELSYTLAPLDIKNIMKFQALILLLLQSYEGQKKLWYPKHFSGSKLLSNWNPHQTTKLLVLRFGAVCPFVHSIPLSYGQIDCAIGLKLCHNTHSYLMVRPTD